MSRAEPVSYSRQIAPILAMRCNSCHGREPAAGLDTRTYGGLMRGGNLGPAVIAGDAERSPLIEYLEGRRGESRRMPLAEPPLPADQIALIRRWVAEGARKDADTWPKYRLSLAGVRMEKGRRLEIRCRVPGISYLRLAVKSDIELHAEETPVRKAGEPVVWSIGAAPDWPSVVDLEVTIMYADREPAGASLTAGGRGTQQLQ